MNKLSSALLCACILINIITPALGAHIQPKLTPTNFDRHSSITSFPTIPMQQARLEYDTPSSEFSDGDEFALLSPRRRLPLSVINFPQPQFQSQLPATDYCKQKITVQHLSITSLNNNQRKLLIDRRDLIAESINMGNLRNIAGLTKDACGIIKAPNISAAPELIVMLDLSSALLDAVINNQLDAIKAILVACGIQANPDWLKENCALIQQLEINEAMQQAEHLSFLEIREYLRQFILAEAL